MFVQALEVPVLSVLWWDIHALDPPARSGCVIYLGHRCGMGVDGGEGVNEHFKRG